MKKWVMNVILGIFIAVFVISGYFLVDYLLESRKQQSTFDDLADIMNQATLPSQGEPAEEAPPVVTLPGSDDPEATVPPEDMLVEVTDPETGEVVEMLPEFVELYTMNNDLVGWISIPDTDVNYPVMQTPDNKDYYLRRDFYGNYSAHGTIYASEYCDVFTPSDNLTIYGHRMNDGSMFYDLTLFQKKDYWEENRTIEFNTLRERNTYEIWCVFTVSSSVGTPFPYHQFIDAMTEEEFDQYIANCQKYSLYDTGIVPQFGDKLITLSTCEYTHVNGRLVVVAVQRS